MKKYSFLLVYFKVQISTLSRAFSLLFYTTILSIFILVENLYKIKQTPMISLIFLVGSATIVSLIIWEGAE